MQMSTGTFRTNKTKFIVLQVIILKNQCFGSALIFGSGSSFHLKADQDPDPDPDPGQTLLSQKVGS
jgi:hypothetical protein